jgi:phosphopantothenoylcysteine synthetase/decarboxylase
MREWLKELYKDMNPLMIDLVSNKTILESIERNYPCGLTAFVKQCKPGNE